MDVERSNSITRKETCRGTCRRDTVDEKRTTNEPDRIHRERKRSRGRIRITVLNPKDFSHQQSLYWQSVYYKRLVL